MFSVDGGIFKAGSAVVERMEHFGTLVEGIDIISLQGSGISASPVMLKNNVTAHPATGSVKLVAAMKALRLAKKLAKDNTVIVTQDPFELGLIGILASWLTRRPRNVQVHIDFFSPYFRQESLRQRSQAFLVPFVLRGAASIRVVSQKIATYLRDSLEIPASKIIIAPIFVEVEAVRNVAVTTDLHAKYPHFDWIVLVACRYVKQKNIPLAIEAFSLFKKIHKNVGLVVAGSGPEGDSLKDLVVELKMDDSVIIGSWASEFASLMKTCDCFLMSSDYEGWGMTVIEAAAVGRPTIMTDVGCADEFLINEKSGLIVETRDPNAMAEALEKLYSNRAFATNLGQEAKRQADIYMTREESDQLMVQSWESALGGATSK